MMVSYETLVLSVSKTWPAWPPPNSRERSMTPQEAIDHSNARVARLIVDDGAVAIARSASGYFVTFIPRTEEGIWNLAATQHLATVETIDEAEQRACENRECVYRAWEPAPENIIGVEPAQSLAPVVTGHHVRFHGRPENAAGFPLEFTAAAGLLLGVAMAAITWLIVKRETEGRLD